MRDNEIIYVQLKPQRQKKGGRNLEDISMKNFQYEEPKERNQERWAEYLRFVGLSICVMEVPERGER